VLLFSTMQHNVGWRRRLCAMARALPRGGEPLSSVAHLFCSSSILGIRLCGRRVRSGAGSAELLVRRFVRRCGLPPAPSRDPLCACFSLLRVYFWRHFRPVAALCTYCTRGRRSLPLWAEGQSLLMWGIVNSYLCVATFSADMDISPITAARRRRHAGASVANMRARERRDARSSAGWALGTLLLTFAGGTVYPGAVWRWHRRTAAGALFRKTELLQVALLCAQAGAGELPRRCSVCLKTASATFIHTPAGSTPVCTAGFCSNTAAPLFAGRTGTQAARSAGQHFSIPLSSL